jgi:hypothetical protein
VKAFFVLAAVLFLPPGALSAADLSWSSGPARVSLIELYTSEGCSSCPPAEAWLDRLTDSPGLWRDFVPIAFHVDYWDNLGWADRFATRQYTRRQYALASAWGGNSVYTPCFVRDGAEWHPDAESRIGRGGRPGVLTVLIRGDTCHVEFAADLSGDRNGAGAWEAHVALLGGGLSSRVTAGENRGRTLTHAFVVLALTGAPLTASNGRASVDLALPTAGDAAPARRALAVWVTRPGELAPVQATGGWLPVRG